MTKKTLALRFFDRLRMPIEMELEEEPILGLIEKLSEARAFRRAPVSDPRWKPVNSTQDADDVGAFRVAPSTLRRGTAPVQ
jgi:hypothetical protein